MTILNQTRENVRRNHLERTTAALIREAKNGSLSKKPIQVIHAEYVRGARVGTVRLYAGLETGTLVSILSAHDAAVARQFIDWDFTGDVEVGIDGRACFISAPWPEDLAVRDVRLSQIQNRPKDGGRWIVGLADGTSTVTLGLSDAVPHYLIAGFTGSGKTEAIRSAVIQLSRDPLNRIVLVDGKQGDGLHPLAHLPGVVAPLAREAVDARNALAYAVRLMVDRYERKGRGENLQDRVIVVADEIQAFTGEKNGDPAISGLLQTLVTQGRGARVHVIIGTQHPVMSAFSDPLVRRNLPGRLALRTEDYKASEVVVGGENPRADKLLGGGDAYAITPTAKRRVQVAWVPPHELNQLPSGQYLMDSWPDSPIETVGQIDNQPFTPEEVAVALAAVSQGAGRPKIQDAFIDAGLPRPGSNRADKLMHYCRSVQETLVERCYQIDRNEDCQP